ncbi:hypothetical protein [Clostridium sp. Marseille-Q2269]|uniref:hypothetical protein n=1 Tax=Clostridium sp. Marseille-Q2269 TaxID=2942205 RepID=UPI00207309FB|nr:hypothetical protein [Clostridium sp. Marseille-Q2269]
MFNYYNPCSMCIPVPVYIKNPQPISPYKHDCMKKSKCTVDHDEDLKRLLPRIYFKIYPVVIHHCDLMEREKGKDYCPSEKELDSTCKEIYKKIKSQLDDDDDDCDCTRQRRYRRRHAVRDIIRILFLNELLRRRRRRRPHRPGYGY